MGDLDDVTLLVDSGVVTTGVEVGEHQLVKGYTGEFGLPVEAYLRLYAVRQDEIVAEVSSPAALSRLVPAVRNLAEALAFLDLFTAPVTHFLFEQYKDVVELVVADPATAAFGAVPAERLMDIGVEPSKALELWDRFVVERNLVHRGEAGVREILRVSEALTRSGSYEEVSRASVAHLAESDVVVPEYE